MVALLSVFWVNIVVCLFVFAALLSSVGPNATLAEQLAVTQPAFVHDCSCDRAECQGTSLFCAPACLLDSCQLACWHAGLASGIECRAGLGLCRWGPSASERSTDPARRLSLDRSAQPRDAQIRRPVRRSTAHRSSLRRRRAIDQTARRGIPFACPAPSESCSDSRAGLDCTRSQFPTSQQPADGGRLGHGVRDVHDRPTR